MVLDQLPTLYRDANLKQYIDSMFGGLEQCRKAILCDFCKHAFDGSGADNFFDAGSCIDGRLTSAWNWCGAAAAAAAASAWLDCPCHLHGWLPGLDARLLLLGHLVR
jgi:hypothetical protein